ncbi:DUF3299 domain-containing protein [Aestuariibacter sp. AA17]|uniref:DUF3299 domain-containing protein n=1 Tax=Fluctibacter corallii TaxID=2984329 RepID=A0ABT3A6J5_9ALTE|nr:DUF3299 domain-containing protein [Aestuariibacter sp. AA17]MCV2884177.1 DUF3299 domain-containing protein [Aestuariibacter sp. AA17]
MEQRRLGWDELIPAKEKALITQYQLNQPETFNEQLDLALRGSADADYQAALISTNTVDELLDLSVSISGFIVPIDVNDEGSTQSFLLVPYFGACIHYPPPPPNQIIYVRLSGSISDYDMEHAYTVEGILSKGMFEDPLGTAAYILDATQVRAYEEAPDTFRQH